jgi:hypothetical protein
MQTCQQINNVSIYQINFLFQILCYCSHDYFVDFHVADQRPLNLRDFNNVFHKNIALDVLKYDI